MDVSVHSKWLDSGLAGFWGRGYGAETKERYHLAHSGPFIRENASISLDIPIPIPPDTTGKESKRRDLKNAKSWISAHMVGGRTRNGVVRVITALSRAGSLEELCRPLQRRRAFVPPMMKCEGAFS